MASLLVLALGGPLVKALLPCIKFGLDLLQPDMDASVSLSRAGWEQVLELRPLTIRPVALTSAHYLPPFTHPGRWTTELSHHLLPATLYLGALWSWPTYGRTDAGYRITASAVGVPFMIIASIVVWPAAQVDIAIVQQATALGSVRREPAIVTALVFLESGGRALLALGLAGLYHAYAQYLFARSRLAPMMGRARQAP